MKILCQRVDQATPQTLQKLLDTNVAIVTTICRPGESIYIPWGYVVAESGVNNEEMYGLRFMIMGKSGTAAFDQMSYFLCPAEGAVVEKGTAAAFMVRIHSILCEQNIASQANSVSSKIKQYIVKTEKAPKRQKTTV